MDFASVSASMDAVVKMYEHKLKDLNPTVGHITYDITNLYEYLDSLKDICALVLDPRSNKYEPKDKDWIKGSVFDHLRGQV